MMGHCNFKDHSRVIMECGVIAKLYGPSLRSEDKGFILFINLLMEVDERQNIITKVVNFTNNRGAHANSFFIGDGSRNASLKDNSSYKRCQYLPY